MKLKNDYYNVENGDDKITELSHSSQIAEALTSLLHKQATETYFTMVGRKALNTKHKTK